MKNLFVLHTQYNMILATGIMLNRFESDQNDLVVYAEFSLSNELKEQLEQAYSHVLYVREQFENRRANFLNTEKSLYRKFKLFKDSSIGSYIYDNVFIAQDRPLENLIVGACKKKNRDCRFWNVEDGCDSYFSINIVENDPNFNPGCRTKRSWLFRKLLYGSTYCSDEHSGLYIYGQSRYFDGIYVIHPCALRPQLKNKLTIEINQKEIIDGVNTLYGNIHLDLEESPKYTLFFFDLVERYNNPEAIKTIVTNIVYNASREGSVVLLKYHPRETNKFIFNSCSNVIEIPHVIPAEKLLCDLFGKEVTVYGNATTAILVAQKLNFKTISVSGFESSNNFYMINKFKEMGIIVPSPV